jgi:hypothetical protein
VIVFLLCGLWHGAAWTFVLWGAWHGGFLVLERAGLGRWLRAAPRPLAWAYALVAVMFGWVLFRSADLGRTLDIWAGMVGLHGMGGLGRETEMALTDQYVWLLPLGALLAVAKLPRVRLGRRALWTLGWADNAAILGLAGLSVLQVAAGTYSPFLYFRF